MAISKLHACALLSQVSKHSKALKYAKSAFNQISKIIETALQSLSADTSNKAKSYQTFLKKLKTYILDPSEKIEWDSMAPSPYLSSKTIPGILNMNKISIEDVVNLSMNDADVEYTTEKIISLVLCCMFCIATEKKLLSHFSK